jgi:PAS domain S-box-containing protein
MERRVPGSGFDPCEKRGKAMQRRILVVEDDRIIAENLKVSLVKMGYTVTSMVSSGDQAIEKVAEDSPHLVLMDIVLQGKMDGIEAADHILSHFNVPIIYLSAYGDEETFKRAKVTGPFGYLLKPFEERELYIAIETALFRHEMEEKVRESEEKYHDLVELANDGIAIIQDNVFKYVNPRLAHITGYSVDELMGSPFATYIHPDYRSVVLERYRNRLKSEHVPSVYETVVQRKDGREIEVEFNAALINYEGAPADLIIMRDISQRKAMEQELHRKTQDLEQTNNQLMMLQNISNALNSAMDQSHILHIVTRAIVETFDFIEPLIFTFSEDGKFLELTDCFLTEQVKKEVKALSGIHLTDFAIPLTHDPLTSLFEREEPFVTDDPEKFLQYFGDDPRIKEIGIPLIERLELECMAVIPLEADDTPLGLLVVGSNHPITGKIMEDLNGFLKQASLAISKAQLYKRLQNANKQLVEMTDTLERKVIERTAQLARANTLKSDFLASMSHEFRTPLNSILSFTDILLLGLDGPVTTEQVEDLKLIKESGMDLLALVNNILDLSKIEAGELEFQLSHVDITEIIDTVISQLMVKAVEKGIGLRSSVPPDLPRIVADESRLKQIVRNLVANAIQFTEKGEVVIGVNPDKSGKRNDTVFWVRDTGIGIPEKDFRVIFEKFRQSRNKQKVERGTGLGLSVCKELVELHGGKIWIESERGKGSTFFFSIPQKE